MNSATPAQSSATRPSLRDSPRRWWLAFLLFTGMLFCYAHRGALSVGAPIMIKEQGLSPAIMGILLSAFWWTYAFMQVPSGWAVDRFGVRGVFAGGYAIWSVASALLGQAGGLVSLIFLRMAQGVGQSVAFPAAARAVANWFHDRERGTVTGTYLTGVRLGQALIAAAGAPLLAAYGLKTFFLLTGLVPLIWILPWWRFMGRHETAPASTQTASPAPAKRAPGFLEGLALLKHRSVLGIFLGFFAFDYVWFLYVTWLPGYLVLERKFTTQQMGVFSSVPFLIMSGVILAAGVLSDWLVRRGYREVIVRKSFIVCGLVVGCLIVPAGMVEDNMLAVQLLTVSLCGLGLVSPNSWTLTQAVCSKRIVGTVSGLQNFGGNVGGIIAPALTGFIAHATGSFALALTIAGAISVGGALAYIFLINRPVDLQQS